MRKIILFLSIFFALAGNAYCGFFGPNMQDILEATDETTTIAVGGATDSIYSKSFTFEGGTYHSIGFKFTSDGSVNVDLELEQGYGAPITEGCIDAKFVVPDNTPTLATITDENWHYIGFNPTAVPYGRIRFDRGAGNDNSTTCVLKYGKFEK